LHVCHVFLHYFFSCAMYTELQTDWKILELTIFTDNHTRWFQEGAPKDLQQIIQQWAIGTFFIITGLTWAIPSPSFINWANVFFFVPGWGSAMTANHMQCLHLALSVVWRFVKKWNVNKTEKIRTSFVWTGKGIGSSSDMRMRPLRNVYGAVIVYVNTCLAIRDHRLWLRATQHRNDVFNDGDNDDNGRVFLS